MESDSLSTIDLTSRTDITSTDNREGIWDTSIALKPLGIQNEQQESHLVVESGLPPDEETEHEASSDSPQPVINIPTMFPPIKPPQLSSSLVNKLRNKVQLMREQAEDEKSLSLSMASTESTVSDISSVSAYSSKMRKVFQNSDSDEEFEFDKDTKHLMKRKIKKMRHQFHCTWHYSIHPHGSFYLWWLGFMFCVYMYNIITLPLRASFPFVQGTNFTPIGTLMGPPQIEQVGLLMSWLVADGLMDILYLVDVIFVCSHLRPIDDQVAQYSKMKLKTLWWRYIRRKRFWLDIVSLTPLEILYLVPLLRFNVLLRIPRLFRIHNVFIFFDQFESSTKYPHAFRLTKMAGYLLYFVHIYACIYYAVSARSGFGVSTWFYNGEGNGYLRCFYWALMSIATIHDLNDRDPVTDIEFVLGAFGHLIGVFIIAIVISEITNIVEAANLQKQLFRQKQDLLKQFMQSHKIPQELQNKVKLWSEYTFTHQRMIDEDQALESLPRKMKSDIAINVHLDTLTKVKIFKGFESNLLRELVLKLHPLLVIPGEFICKKGEIGREMFIVNQGKVQVLGGPDDDLKILVELGPGSVFGEISLLAVGGGNRRTAHVRSKGFSNLFVLSKKDLYETLVDYPKAQDRLKKKAKFILHQDKKRTSQSVPPSGSAFAKIAMEAKKKLAEDKSFEEGNSDFKAQVNVEVHEGTQQTDNVENIPSNPFIVSRINDDDDNV